MRSGSLSRLGRPSGTARPGSRLIAKAAGSCQVSAVNVMLRSCQRARPAAADRPTPPAPHAIEKWTKWASLSTNRVNVTKLKKGKRYVLQVQAVGDAGRGPIATWRFKARK